jgi:putative tryptophan/tyrosine transport system substrate-binding protein
LRRRSFLSLVAGATAEWCLPALALNNPPRIGFLGAATAAGWSRQIDALRSGLRDLGYIEGKNIAIEYRWAEGNDSRLPELTVAFRNWLRNS